MCGHSRRVLISGSLYPSPIHKIGACHFIPFNSPHFSRFKKQKNQRHRQQHLRGARVVQAREDIERGQRETEERTTELDILGEGGGRDLIVMTDNVQPILDATITTGALTSDIDRPAGGVVSFADDLPPFTANVTFRNLCCSVQSAVAGEKYLKNLIRCEYQVHYFPLRESAGEGREGREREREGEGGPL